VNDRLNRHDLADEEWQRLLPMMPADARQGRRWSDHRMVINGIPLNLLRAAGRGIIAILTLAAS
jgi:transposase